MKSNKIIILSLILVSLSLAVPASAADSKVAWQPWRCTRNQGVNTLFCYFQINNIACDYSKLLEEQISDSGTGSFSANTLVRIAEKHRLPLRVASLNMKELDACGKPAITYMTSDNPDDGGFLLVLNSTENQVFYVDGATAALQTMSREDFRRVWSGIALLPAEDRAQNWTHFAFGSTAGLILVLLTRSRLTPKTTLPNQ